MTTKCVTLKPMPGEAYTFASNAVMDLMNNLPFLQVNADTDEVLGEVTWRDLKSHHCTHAQLYYRSNQYITVTI